MPHPTTARIPHVSPCSVCHPSQQKLHAHTGAHNRKKKTQKILKDKRRGTKRLTHPNFLKRYANILKKNAPIHLKTDSQFLHGFTLGIIAGEKYILEDSTHDLYNSTAEREHMGIKTHYEQIYLDKGMPITYLRFRLK